MRPHERLDVGTDPASQQLQANISHLTDVQQHADVGRHAATCRPARSSSTWSEPGSMHEPTCVCRGISICAVTMAPQRQGTLYRSVLVTAEAVYPHTQCHTLTTVCDWSRIRSSGVQCLGRLTEAEAPSGSAVALMPTWSPAQQHNAVQCSAGAQPCTH